MKSITEDIASSADAAAFSQLQLGAAMLANLQQLGYTQMTAIQAASLPLALQGRDVIAQASTGSGKTAAFGMALLARLNPRWFAVQSCCARRGNWQTRSPTKSAVWRGRRRTSRS